MAIRLRADVTYLMGGCVGMTIGMAIETSNAHARFFRPPIRRKVELLLRKRSQKQAQSVELLGIEDAVKKFVIVLVRDQHALRHVSQVGPRGQIDWRRELGKKLIGDVIIKIKAGQIASFLLLDLFDFKMRKDHSAFWLIRVRHGKKSLGEQILASDFV